jgi:FMN phosphatase YigB (HAD superfamily)
MKKRVIAFDWGHTQMDERRDAQVPLDARPVHLMPGVADVLPRLSLPLAVWANTRITSETAVRGWLDRARLGPFFLWVITSVDAGARKPAPEFFQYALGRCGLAKEDVLFVGNQLNADIAGGEAIGIRTNTPQSSGARTGTSVFVSGALSDASSLPVTCQDRRARCRSDSCGGLFGLYSFRNLAGRP